MSIYVKDYVPALKQGGIIEKENLAPDYLYKAVYDYQLAAFDTNYKYGCDDTCTGTSDNVKIQAAIDALSAVGGGTLHMRGGTYTFSAAVIMKSNVTVTGDGIRTVIKTSAALYAFDSSTVAISDVVFERLCFVGTATEFPTNPKRGRTTSGAGMICGIRALGSLQTGQGYPVITNVDIRNCVFKNIQTSASPPFLLGGVTGVARVVDCTFDNTLDGGFIWNEEVIYMGNHVKMSSDNGVSISRGNVKITCVGNTFENCCYSGIWLSGYIGSLGPTDFTCTGNSIRNVGYAGIALHDAPNYGVIADNIIDGQYHRGPSDGTSDFECSGIMISGYPYTSPSSPSSYAMQLTVTGNLIRTMPKAGIYYNGCKNIKISDNLILDCGTQFLANGSTTILSSNVTQNIGILGDDMTTVTNVIVTNNDIIDSRVTPYCNLGVYPLTDANLMAQNNRMIGLRNTPNLISQNPGGQSFSRTAVADTAYAILTGDYLISYTSLSAGRTATLPTAVGCTGQQYIIKDEAGNANTFNITVATTSAQTIDGASTKTISTAYGILRVMSNGANWFTF